MSDSKKREMTRKDFIKKSSAGIIGIGLSTNLPDLIATPEKDKHQTAPKYRMLGRTGLNVTKLGFGAARTMEPALVKTAINAGINFIDTGRSYANGKNEEMIGNVIKGFRDKVIIQSKMKIPIREKGDELKSDKASKKIKKIMESALKQSLKALQTDYIDIMLLHRMKSVELIQHETVLKFLEAAKQTGKVRAIGFSSHQNQIELLKIANENKFYDVVMVPYNHKGAYVHSKYPSMKGSWDQPALEVELKKAEENNLGIVAMKTCSAGPFALNETDVPSFKGALEWVINHSYVCTMAVAMANFDEVNHDVQVMM
jgi:uncharacterized protein